MCAESAFAQDYEDMKAAVKEVIFVADLRDSELKCLKALNVAEVKVSAKHRQIPFRANIRKGPLIDIMIGRRCHSLSFLIESAMMNKRAGIVALCYV